MSITGFKFGENIERYDYECLDNKPFGEQASTSITILDLKDIEFTDSSDNVPGTIMCSITEGITAPKLFIPNSTNFVISIDDGEPIQVTNMHLNEDVGGPCLGNLGIAGIGEDTGEEYLIAWMQTDPDEGTWAAAIGLKSTEGTHSIKLTCECGEEGCVIASEETLETDDSAYYPAALNIEEGIHVQATISSKLGVIEIDDNIKTLDFNGTKAPYLGNAYMTGIPDATDTGENYIIFIQPFNGLVIVLAEEPDDYIINFSLKVLGGIEIKQLDNKFIGINIPTPIGKSGTGYTSEIHNHSENIASGDFSFAQGIGTTASGYGAHSEGVTTEASGYYSHSEGGDTIASGKYSHSEGNYTTSEGESSHAEGYRSESKQKYSHAEGERTIANGRAQHVEGRYNIEDTELDSDGYGKYAHIIGNGKNNRSNAHTLDWSGNAWYAGNLVVKGNVYYGGENGQSGTLLRGVQPGTGSDSDVFGSECKATGHYSFAQGNRTTAIGYYTHAEGESTVASRDNSHAEGIHTIALGYNSHAEGQGAGKNTTRFTGTFYRDYAILTKQGLLSYISEHHILEYEGKYYMVTSTEPYEDDKIKCTIKPDYLSASYPTSGQVYTYHTTCTLGYGAHAEGTICKAIGDYSHAEGRYTKAIGEGSHSEGSHTIAAGEGQHVEGKYNIEDTENKYAHIIGNGDDTPSNAYTLDWEGNAWYAGTTTAKDIAIEGADGTVIIKSLLATIEDLKSRIEVLENTQISAVTNINSPEGAE